MAGKEIFANIDCFGNKFFHSIYMLRDSKEYKDVDNKMFDSLDIGSVTDNNVSVRTSTITIQDEGENPVTRDVVVLNANDACDKVIEVLLTKQDCIELMAYLSAATFALRD